MSESGRGLLNSQCSFSGDGILATTYIDDYTVRGAAFLFQKNYTIADAGTLYILIDYTTYTGANSLVFVRPAVFSTTYGPVIARVYRGTNYSGGTEEHAYNLNTVIGGESQTTITSGATGTTKGTVAQEWLVGFGSTNQSSGGGSVTVDANIIRDNTSKSLIEIVNNSGNEITFNIVQELLEI